MIKKYSKRTKTTKKPLNWTYYGRRYVLLLLVSITSFTVVTVAINISHASPTCANSQTCTADLSEKIENNIDGIFQGKLVIPPHVDIHDDTHAVLGTNITTGEKHIYVDLATQTLYAYEGGTLILKTFISSGKWTKTPVGNFHIWEKLRATRMAGGEGADAYDLPNVPYVMYFYNDFGIHGAYWHDNFGHPMSHGCVNMRAIDAKTIYDWVDGPTSGKLGTAVSICDQVTGSHQCIQNKLTQSL